MKQHVSTAAHDGYAAHSHEIRPDHAGVRRASPAVTGAQLRDELRALSRDDLVAILMALCSGMHPRTARDSVLAELARHGATGEVPPAR